MDIDKYILLRDKERRGKLNQEEQAALQHWMQSAEGKAFATIEQLTDVYKSNYEPNVEVGLARLKARMQKSKVEETPVRTLSVASRRPWMRVAAAILVVAVAMVALRGLFQSEPERVVIATQATENRNLTLTDGTKVQLNANSTITLPESFENANKRVVELTGEAYFAVAPNPAKPFAIEAQEVTVTVVGTAFNVRAYPTETTVEVEVEEGVVQMEVGNQQITLAAGEKGVFNSRDSKLSKKQAPQLNAQAWRTHQLKFSNAPLSEILQELARYHRVQIEVANDALKNCSYTCNFGKTKLEDALQALRVSLNLQWEKPASNHYIIRGGACR